MIKKLHKTLMNKLILTNGKLRSELEAENEVSAERPDGSTHHYPHHTRVGSMLTGVIDQHNIHMANIPEAMAEKVPFVIKSAVWLLAQLISIHPFVDGNGRMCRLLASHILSQIIPFPVHTYKTGDIDRQHYIKAIISCQDDNGDLEQLAALLVDSICNGLDMKEREEECWKSYKEFIVIPVQICEKDVVWKKVKEIFESATEEDEQKITELCEIEVTTSDSYREVVLMDTTSKIQYIVRVFKNNLQASVI